jgi:hypothetical protein
MYFFTNLLSFSQPYFTFYKHFKFISKNRKPPNIGGFQSIYPGAGGRNRTPDLLITSQLLYQLSYASTFGDP